MSVWLFVPAYAQADSLPLGVSVFGFRLVSKRFNSQRRHLVDKLGNLQLDYFVQIPAMIALN